jgi:hypothetical protein
MVRRILIIAGLLCAPLLAAAQQTLNIHTTTQGTVSFAFATKPVVTFVAPETLKVVSATMTVEFPYADIEKLTFSDTATGVESLSVSEATDGVSVYDLSGKLVLQVANADGTARLDLSSLRPGIYVVKDGRRSYKVRKQ